ncbi:MAG: hypothetical protein AMS26_11810 [Bacteroides sp. SM23_62]|nr:MAG: hypothetical protein AMS26_11810 [Bacteroides sp. SM23_62]
MILSGSLCALSFLIGSGAMESLARTPMGIADKAAALKATPLIKFRLEGDLFVFSMSQKI